MNAKINFAVVTILQFLLSSAILNMQQMNLEFQSDNNSINFITRKKY